jgi:D-ribose pyranose/furanose isomerase RbsD
MTNIRMTALLCVLLLMAGCTTTQVSTTLNVASSTVNDASSALAGWDCSSVPAVCSEKTQIVASLNALAAALSTAGTDLNSGTITSTEIASISATLSQNLITNFPAVIPTNIKAILLAVSAGVQAFIVVLQTTNTGLKIRNVKEATSVTFKLTWEDHRKVNQAIGWLGQAKKTLATIH